MDNQKGSEKSPTVEALQGDLPERHAKAAEQGYWGSVPDPTPNEAYTLSGVTAGAPTPETDAELAADAEQRSEELGNEAGGNADGASTSDSGTGEPSGEANPQGEQTGA